MEHRLGACRHPNAALKLDRKKHFLSGAEQSPLVQSGCGNGLIDALLFVNAFYLAWLAGKALRKTPIRDTLWRLCRYAVVVPTKVRPLDVRCAATRATRCIGRLGGLDSCLTRSLVIARLLRDRDNVSLCLGFMPADDPGMAITGHAWVCIDGTNISDKTSGFATTQVVETNRLELRNYR